MRTTDLGDLCEVIGGGTPAKDKPAFYDGHIPWATIRDMQHDVIQTTEFKITKEAVQSSSTNIIPRGNVVIATRVGLGKVCLINQDTAINQDLRGIIPRDTKKLDVRFLFWWLKSVSHLIVEAGTGATVQGVKLPFIKSLQLPVLPLSEQKQIVAILDESFEGIAAATANAEKNLANARELLDSYLNSIFSQKGESWMARRLGDVFDIGSSKRILETEWTATGVPFYGGKEIVKLAKFGTVVSNAYISEEKYLDYASKYDMPQQGDILITARGTIGVGYVVKKGDKFYYKDGNIISMREKIPTNPDFILYAFKSNVMADQLGNLTGTTVRHLPIEKAKVLVLAMPDFSTQNNVVEKIQELECETRGLEAMYDQKLSMLAELKQSILSKAFSGELTLDAIKTAKKVAAA